MSRPLVFRPRVFPLAHGRVRDVGRLLARLEGFSGRVALDSAGGRPARFSLVGFDPLPLELDRLDLAGLRSACGRIERGGGDEVPGPFHGGFLGALSYDLGVFGERPVEVAPDPWRSPRIVGGLYVDFVVVDHERDESWLVLGEDPGDGRASVADRRAAFEERVDRDGGDELGSPGSIGSIRSLGPLERHVDADEHRARVERIRESIARGDIYQANLAHRFTRRIAGDPVDLYRRLRERNPAPYMTYLEWDAQAAESGGGAPRPGSLLSASPELLLAFDGRVARTRPIKGTVPRSEDPLEDAQLARALLASEKDRAELAMIVDLERNDLGRVAEIGSVTVEEFPRLESYATVHHLVADVVCRIAPERDAFDLLGAVFPGGSITGAPKLESMRVIAREESEGRGFFSGSCGFVDTRGHALFNILIRTLVWRPLPDESGENGETGEASFHVGGGITWSSDPVCEEQETLVKGAALAECLGASLDVDATLFGGAEPDPRTTIRS